MSRCLRKFAAMHKNTAPQGLEARRKPLRVDLTLQGGGAHGAVTYGQPGFLQQAVEHTPWHLRRLGRRDERGDVARVFAL